MQTFKVGDVVVLEQPYSRYDEAKGSVGHVTRITDGPLGFEQDVYVTFWVNPSRTPVYSAWRLKPL